MKDTHVHINEGVTTILNKNNGDDVLVKQFATKSLTLCYCEVNLKGRKNGDSIRLSSWTIV